MSEHHSSRPLRVASYNIHSWKGMDGVVAPQRIMAVVAGMDADVVALQEVVSPHLTGGEYSLHEMAQDNGFHVTFGPTMLRSDSRYGNALLSKKAPIEVRRHSLECRQREPRGALDVTFVYGGTSLRILTTHLGLKRWERVCQMRALEPLLHEHEADVTIFMGDLNEWLPWGYARRSLRTFFGETRAPRTFPSRLPILALDRIHVLPSTRLLSLDAERNLDTRVASDHLPVLAQVDMAPGERTLEGEKPQK